MRKLLPALLLCGTLLPGCVLAIGNGDDDKNLRRRIDNLEHRVNMLEQNMSRGPHGQGYGMENDEREEYEGHEGHDGPDGPDGQPMHH